MLEAALEVALGDTGRVTILVLCSPGSLVMNAHWTLGPGQERGQSKPSPTAPCSFSSRRLQEEPQSYNNVRVRDPQNTV